MSVHMTNNTAPIGSFVYNDTAMTVSHEGVAVKLDTTTAGAVKIAGAGDVVLGIIGDTILYAVGDPIPVYGIEGQIIDATAGAAGFSIGDLVKVTTSGASVTAGGTDPYYGLAVDTATSGNLGRVIIKDGGSIATNTTWTRSSTTLYPTNDADTIATGPAASDATGLSMIGITGAGQISAIGTGSAIDILLTPKSTGKVLVGASDAAGIPVVTAPASGQGTTGTSGTAGRITVASLTTAGVVIATMAESITTTALAYVVASAGYFTAYDNTNTAISGKKINYLVLSL